MYTEEIGFTSSHSQWHFQPLLCSFHQQRHAQRQIMIIWGSFLVHYPWPWSLSPVTMYSLFDRVRRGERQTQWWNFGTIHGGSEPRTRGLSLSYRPARHRLRAGTTTRFLVVRFPDPIDCFKIPAQAVLRMVSKRRPASLVSTAQFLGSRNFFLTCLIIFQILHRESNRSRGPVVFLLLF